MPGRNDRDFRPVYCRFGPCRVLVVLVLRRRRRHQSPVRVALNVPITVSEYVIEFLLEYSSSR